MIKNSTGLLESTSFVILLISIAFIKCFIVLHVIGRKSFMEYSKIGPAEWPGRIYELRTFLILLCMYIPPIKAFYGLFNYTKI